ncbi:MAG TPA: helix-turn-helix domain-containing protein [Acidimicrobiia bacterium]|nr:helix-turn-helix domain-containing protein [Acidimicrobiia bacterium]
MPERSFGRTVRYRRTRLGLNQAKLGELVGRSAATVRSWERDESRPTDAKVLAALSAVLGINERQLFDKAEVERLQIEKSAPTVKQAFASLGSRVAGQSPQPETGSASRMDDDYSGDESVHSPGRSETAQQPGANSPAYVAPPDPYVRTPPTPTLTDVSYMEDPSQRQMYRVRTLATLVGVVALVVALIWAIQQGLGAFDAWWNYFFGQLRL